MYAIYRPDRDQWYSGHHTKTWVDVDRAKTFTKLSDARKTARFMNSEYEVDEKGENIVIEWQEYQRASYYGGPMETIRYPKVYKRVGVDLEIREVTYNVENLVEQVAGEGNENKETANANA